ncbi:MAG: gamma-glutamyltransferase [Alphaproteobacteria bacterium]|nr:gamma-glutamyltransferase [Alphaproteobacteria bacterium]
MAEGGAEEFYTGETARRMVAAVRGDAFDGRMTLADLAGYRAIERAAPCFGLGAWRVATAPLPAYGGIAAGQLIGIAARLGITGIGAVLSEQEIHLLAESGRVAFADREHYADPDHVADGRGVDVATLLSPDYLARRARHIDPLRRNDRIPAGHTDGLGGSMTSHVSIADGAGQMVAMTTTINQNFGARISVGGFYLNNALTNFALQPISHGRRVANAMAPGKRPRTSIAPCIVMDADGRAVAALGAGGGFRIIGYVANALLRLAGGMRDPVAIVAAAHAMNWSGSTEIEPVLAHHAAGLVGRGHFVVTRRFDGGTQMVLADGGDWLAAGDPRRDGVGVVLR